MGLENPSISIGKLKDKLQKKYPNHNFDIASLPDTKCRFPHRCKQGQPVYYDKDGNYFCAVMDKVVTDLGSMKNELQGCNAYLIELTQKKQEEKRRVDNTPIF